MLKVQHIRKKLKNGQPSVGTWMQLASTDAAEIISRCGYDWVAVDMEHGGFSRLHLADLFRAIEIGGALPFARVAETAMMPVRSALDAGARGIILPMIESAAQLEDAIRHIYYPPDGIRGNKRGGSRGVGFCRANLFGEMFDEYLNGESRETLVVAQIEHIRGVAALNEILAVPGLDAIMVGPYDLSGSMGMPGDFGNPEFEKVMAEIASTAREFKVAMGAHVVEPDPAQLKARIDQGYLFVAYGIDAVFMQRMAKLPDIF